jgi:hypothetical protein
MFRAADAGCRYHGMGARLGQPTADEDEPPSPCIKVCRIDPASGRCVGCLRTGEEIGAWPLLDAAAKRALLQALARRRQSAIG